MHFRKIYQLLALATASFAIGTIYGQEREAVSRVEEIVVTSSRIPQALRELGTSMSVMTAKDIAAHGNLALNDVLRRLPAISTSSTGGAGKPSSLRVRGEEGYRTLTIVDGLRLSDPASPQVGPQLEHILSSGIGRVEILRGPRGLSYGADAGGIVNLSSRHVDDGLQLVLDAQGGKFGTRQYSANAIGGNTRANYFLSVTDLATNGFNSQSTDVVLKDADGYTNETVHTGGSFNISKKLSLDLVHRKVDGDSRFDGCYDQTFTLSHHCADEYGLQASRAALNFGGAGFKHALSYSTTKTGRENFSAGAPTFKSAGELNRLEYIGSATSQDGFDLVFGADFEEALNNDIGRNSKGVFLEYLSHYSNNLFLTAGLRHDDNDDFGINNSYRVSGAYLFDLGRSAAMKFKGSYGTGFRAPSPYEISYNSGPFAAPPAALVNLRQEQSKGYEIGVEYWRDESLHLEGVYFRQNIKDAIEFDLANFSGYLQDAGHSTSHGLELSGNYSPNDSLRLTANYTYNPTERPNSQPRLRRPENTMNLGATFSGMQQRLDIHAFYRISRNSVDESNGALIKLKNFAVLDLSASFSITEVVQLYARAENLLDENYEDVAGYYTAGRAAYVGIRINYSSL